MRKGKPGKERPLQHSSLGGTAAAQLHQDRARGDVADDVARMLLQHGKLHSVGVVLLQLCDLHHQCQVTNLTNLE